MIFGAESYIESENPILPEPKWVDCNIFPVGDFVGRISLYSILENKVQNNESKKKNPI